MSQHEIEQIELTIEEARKMVDRAAMARRLSDNPDFKKLVLEGYFHDEAARLTHLLSDPMIVQQKQSELVLNDLMAIGGLKRFLTNTIHFGDIAEREIQDANLELEELRQEDGE